MKITLPTGEMAWLIGDPHLGKSFERGVPPHRRGEREKSQFARFVTELETPDVDYIVMVGDLFEHPHVGKPIVVAAAEAFLNAADRRPETSFIALAGNHDVPRDLTVVGAWSVFERIVSGRFDNMVVVSKPCVFGEMALLPWQWGVNAVDQLEWLTDDCLVAIGHWDLQSFGGDDSHICPTQELHALGIETIYSGHYHLAGDYRVAGHTVHCTGSMEPYSHAEDPEGDIYVTLTLAEATDGRDLSDKFVRLDLEPGEVVPEDLDCQCLQRRVSKPEAVEAEPMADFDWKEIMTQALSGLTVEVRDFIQERMPT